MDFIINWLTIIYLSSFIPVLFLVIILWKDVAKRPQFGQRPKYLFISILLMSGIGILQFCDFMLPGIFPPESSYLMYLIFTILYILLNFFTDYSIHSQRIEKSFANAELRPHMRSFLVFLIIISILTLGYYCLYFLRDSFNGEIVRNTGMFPLESVNQFIKEGTLAKHDFAAASIIPFGLISIMFAIFMILPNRRLFQFQEGVIRKSRVFATVTIIIFSVYFLTFIFNGFLNKIYFWFFIVNNIAYMIRVVNEYFYQRTQNLDRKIQQQEERLFQKDEIINKVINSTSDEDIIIIRDSLVSAIKRTRSQLTVPEYGISGAILYSRYGKILKVSSREHIFGYCLPLIRLDVLKHMKGKEQLEENIIKTAYNIEKIDNTKEENLYLYGEKLIKQILDTKRAVIIEKIPDELTGLQRFIGLFPLYENDNLRGVLVLFKDSFDRLFPEEASTVNSLIENFKVIFSIIDGKYIQQERNRLQGEIDLAKQIQTSIIPKEIVIPGYECTASMVTASEVGGDVYDFSASDFGTYFGIGDVSGHGLPAGITALIQLSAFQSAIMTSQTLGKKLHPHEIYDLVNKVLCEINRNRIGSDKFMTQNYFLEHGGKITHAGSHVISLLYRKNKETVTELTELANRTAFLGISEHIKSETSAGEFSMDSGDILFLYTDGIIEAKDHNSNQFGLEKLKQVLTQYATDSLEKIIEQTMEKVTSHAKNGDIKKYNGNLADDASIFIIRKK